MSRRISILGIILVFATMFLIAGAVSAADYHEAPMLADKVAAGELPRLQNGSRKSRLSNNHWNRSVFTVVRFDAGSPDQMTTTVMFVQYYDSLVRFSQDGNSTYPHLIKSLEPNEDYTVWTF